MLEEWKLKLISKPFELKQNKYDCNSTFIIFLDVAIITAPEKRTKKTIEKLKIIAGRILNK